MTEDLNVANAQSNDSASILVPSNINRTENSLKNDQSANPSSLVDSPALVAAISAGTALLGGIIGSILTYRVEDKKYKREKDKQDHIEANVRALMLYNLKFTSDILEELNNKYLFVNKATVWRRKLALGSLHKQYAEMSFETKSTCFKPDVLTALQQFNDYLEIFSVALSDIFTRYEGLLKTDERVALDKMNVEISDMRIDDLNEVAKKAINLLRKNI